MKIVMWPLCNDEDEDVVNDEDATDDDGNSVDI